MLCGSVQLVMHNAFPCDDSIQQVRKACLAASHPPQLAPTYLCHRQCEVLEEGFGWWTICTIKGCSRTLALSVTMFRMRVW